MRYTGNLAPLPTCRRMGDLLCQTFGDEPGKRDIIKAGEHVGLAPTSILEPMVLLYRLTGESRYLDFCKYIFRAWEQPNGPKVISTLLTAKRVDKVGNGKAYEMLSCLNGALEYYRTVGDPQILAACSNAWEDIVRHRLYITGAASYAELFHDDFDLPNAANVGETCVTVTWLQFNAQLLRLTGEARFAEQLEHVILNQLLGAQRCDGSAWGYYVQMEGKKPYSSSLDGHCCLSSGPRGIALIPTFAVATDADGVVLNLYDAGRAELALRDGTTVGLTFDTRYPSEEKIQVTVNPSESKTFAVKTRIPAWCASPEVRINGKSVTALIGPDGYIAVRREWKQRDRMELRFKLEPCIVVGDHMNQGKVAVLYGPLVLAADEALLGSGDLRSSRRTATLTRPDAKKPDVKSLRISSIAPATTNLAALEVSPEPAPESLRSWPSAQVFRIRGVVRRATGSFPAGAPLDVRLVPFADAGASGTSYAIWLPVGLSSSSGNVLLGGQESRSRAGNVGGSIIDEDPQSFVVTFNGERQAEDWFAVTLDEPVAVGRVEFAHGKTFHDGGWFDASRGKPHVQVKTTQDAPWEPVGELKDYPAPTATDSAGLQSGERFTCQFKTPLNVLAIQVVGKPACGDNSQQAFASCAEIQAFGPQP
jgi:uncharacterized protein